jgi:hypothetical protein
MSDFDETDTNAGAPAPPPRPVAEPAELTEIEKIQRRRAERRAAQRKPYDDQRLKDMTALDELEEKHGHDRVASLDVPSFVAGMPTMVVLRTATKPEGKRFSDMARRATKNNAGAAVDTLAAAVVVYPDRETYTRMCEEWPNLHESVGQRAIQMIQAKTDDEGKD